MAVTVFPFIFNMYTTKIKFTAFSIAWTEGGIMHLDIKASAGSKISIAWGNGSTTSHTFLTDSKMQFKNDYFPKRIKPPDGLWFQVEISAENPDCRIIGFSIDADMGAENLDVSNCPELEELNYSYYAHSETCNLDLSRNTALKYLNCVNNGFTSLDLSNNTALEVLSCRGNRLSYLSLTSNYLLEELNCEYNGMKQLFIGYAPQLREVAFEEGNHIDEATKRQIQVIIAENQT